MCGKWGSESLLSLVLTECSGVFAPQKIGENVELNDYAAVNTFLYMPDCLILYSYSYPEYQEFSIQIPLAVFEKEQAKTEFLSSQSLFIA